MSEKSSGAASREENQSPGFLMRSTIKTIGLKFPAVKNISTTSLSKWLATPEERGIALLDCRAREEYEVSHLEDALDAGHQRKTVEELVAFCNEKLKDKPNATIVCYCSVGYRSSDVAQSLTKYFDKSGTGARPGVFNLEGSLFKWAQERRPMVDACHQPTRYVHPYSGVFGILVDKELRKEKL